MTHMTWIGDVALVLVAVTLVVWTAHSVAMTRRRIQAERASRRYHTYAALDAHFGGMPLQSLVCVRRQFPAHFRADLQKALDAVFGGTAVRAFHGVKTRHHELNGISALLDDNDWAPEIAPPEYVEVDVGESDPVRCVRRGLWLVEEGGVRYAVFVTPQDRFGEEKGVLVEVAVPAGDAAATVPTRVFQALESGIQRAASYRGKVLSLESSTNFGGYATGIRVHRLTPVERDQVVLPAPVLDLIDRNVLRFVANRDRLAALGQRLFKGILLYGPPGTGKTYTIHWLARALPDHTFLLITAEQVGLFSEYMALARMLQPSVVVVEDADLIAREREAMGNVCTESSLNGLLNELDGLREDARVLVVLTTNRPASIEPALAGRPGRVDQAIEIPLPDDECRARLVALYGRGLELAPGLAGELVRRTDRASAAFIKELLRKMTQHAFERTHPEGGNGSTKPRLEAADLEGALDELLVRGGRLNASLLGVAEPK